MKKWFLFAFLAAGISQQAAASTYVDSRGYATCEKHLADELDGQGATFARTYYVERGEDQRTFYINANVWANDKRAPVRATCTTTGNGREILRLELGHGGTYAFDNGSLAVR